MCTMTHPCVTELVYMCDMTRLQIIDVVMIRILCTHLVKMCTMTHPCVTELIYMCDMTRLQIIDVSYKMCTTDVNYEYASY